MGPLSPLVSHRFHSITVIRDHVFFPGKVQIPKHLLDVHQKQVSDAAARQAEIQRREGMTAEEIADREAVVRAGRMESPRDADGKRLDGPTPEAWIAAGYSLDTYPPDDYAALPSEKGEGEIPETAATVADVEARDAALATTEDVSDDSPE